MLHLLVIIKDNLLFEAKTAKTAKDLEFMFLDEVKGYGVVPTDVDYENGYIQLECGTTICMTHV